ncbi:hypothetical protein AVEN_34027-1 [Araneus ventricosus]|uniref:Uncharacterized protein n=1 Tax=Araneus ventricosus TaxID=182803 RepID=A0A4Y2NS22_ARAVE|nr:hypothetical protein AVEN_34027-1 [Araneus ventricosus]
MNLGICNYYKSGKSAKELVLHVSQKSFHEINAVVSNTDSNARFPSANPFILQKEIKEKVNIFKVITNMSNSRKGKIIFSMEDPICAAQLLSLHKISNASVYTDIIWENINSRFLVYDVPVSITMEDSANELSDANNIELIEMRCFVKQNDRQDASPPTKL